MSFICRAQKYGLEKVDSLIAALQKDKTDIGRIRLMTDVSSTLYCYNNVLGLEYAEKALTLSEKTGYQKGAGLSYYAAGVNYIFRGDFAKSIDNLTKSEEILQKTDDVMMLARCYMQIANAHLFVAHSDTAFDFINKAIRLFTQVKDSSGLAEAYRTTGLIYQYAGSYDTSIIWFNKGYTISKLKGLQDISGLLLADLGATYAGQNNYIKSLTYSSDAMKLLEKINGGYLAVPIGNIGYIYYQTKDYAKAKSYLQRAVDVAEKQNDIYRTAGSLSLLASIFSEEKDYNSALKNFGRSLELMKQIKNVGEICAGYGNIGDTYHKMGNYALAFDYLFIALKMSYEQNDKWHGNYYLYAIGNVYLQLSKDKSREFPQHSKIPHNRGALLQKAEEYLVKARSMALEADDLDDMVLISKAISELRLLQGQPLAALNAYKESVLFNDSVNNISKLKDFARKEIEYEYSKQQDSIKLVNDQKESINKAQFALQRKATEEERLSKRIAGVAVILLLLVSTFIYFLFLQRKKLSRQLEKSLTTLKETQAQLINIEKEKESEKIRQGISRDLHDNLGSTLSGIAMYSHMMDGQLKSGNYTDAKTSIAVIQKSTNEIVGKLSDLVWSANPGQDSLQQLLERLHQYGLEMCSAKNIQFKMDNFLTDKIFYLPPEHRYYIYLVAKEAMNNAVKYSTASLLKLNVKEIEGVLEIIVLDNGKGFSVNETKKGNGLDNMEKRMHEIGAVYSLYSEPGAGCKISIQLKITQ